MFAGVQVYSCLHRSARRAIHPDERGSCEGLQTGRAGTEIEGEFITTHQMILLGETAAAFPSIRVSELGKETALYKACQLCRPSRHSGFIIYVQ